MREPSNLKELIVMMEEKAITQDEKIEYLQRTYDLVFKMWSRLIVVDPDDPNGPENQKAFIIENIGTREDFVISGMKHPLYL